MTTEEHIKFIEGKIQQCIDMKDMEFEKWAFIQCLKNARKINELLPVDIPDSCTLKCTECKNFDIKVINKKGGTYKICKAKEDDPRVIVDLTPKECKDYIYGW